MQLDEVLKYLRGKAGAGHLTSYVPMQESQLALLADFVEQQGSKLISHPTDICECRFDCSDGVMKVKHQCAYHKGIADRLDASAKEAQELRLDLAIDRSQFADLENELDTLRELLKAAESRLEDALKFVRALSWYDDEVGSIASAAQRWLEGIGEKPCTDSATADEWRTVVERQSSNPPDYYNGNETICGRCGKTVFLGHQCE